MEEVFLLSGVGVERGGEGGDFSLPLVRVSTGMTPTTSLIYDGEKERAGVGDWRGSF